MILTSRLYGGDHGAHDIYCAAVERRLLPDPIAADGLGCFDGLPLRDDVYGPLVDAAGYDKIGAWWTHDNPLPIHENNALVAADAAYFLLTMPLVSTRKVMSHRVGENFQIYILAQLGTDAAEPACSLIGTSPHVVQAGPS